MKIKNILFVVFATLLASGCVTTLESKKATMTPLEIQSLQSRAYESTKKIVFASIISVFQDIGYTITNADTTSGLISGESSAKSDASFILAWLDIKKFTQTKATAFVEQIGDKINVRLSFIKIDQRSSRYGQTERHDTPLLDAKLYQSAFEKIENAIFIRSSS